MQSVVVIGILSCVLLTVLWMASAPPVVEPVKVESKMSEMHNVKLKEKQSQVDDVDTKEQVTEEAKEAKGELNIGYEAPTLDGDIFNTHVWLNNSVYDHDDHESHVQVAEVGMRLLNVLTSVKAIRSFSNLVSRSCGSGKREVARVVQVMVCLEQAKQDVLDIVEEKTIPNSTLRDEVIITSLCGVVPRIVQCKEEMAGGLTECPDYTGQMQLSNKMHVLMVSKYCADGAHQLRSVLKVTSEVCARKLLQTLRHCWGKTGLDYFDLISTLQRMSTTQSKCQQLVGTQLCTAEQYTKQCPGPLAELVQRVSKSIKSEFSCYEYGREARHTLGL